MMAKWFTVGAIAALLGSVGLCLGANALPGDIKDDVEAWIEANPSFRESQINNLTVTRFNTAAQKFTFEASLYSPTYIDEEPYGLVRSEEISFFDVTNGVTFERLEEALRTIYGVNVYQDYAAAREVYAYPSISTINRSKRTNLLTLRAQTGRLYEGDRFAYWIEVIKVDPDNSDFANRGKIVVMEKFDLPALENQLSSR
ncbi:hypothetical protein [[Limnothrix rosea] IAM M-220]|uniref:hypothetical protein n=1 Tax=[Limnothrix rosea] IAM M-220 TaxID=454133 RepID=UPI000963769B|nr:hypothetical protein [[Limnothrix rosea] IAM M-220]OKH19756.1 hypothetical protein NIES208_01105 [[Limnothrix rosea] IAM M-220]